MSKPIQGSGRYIKKQVKDKWVVWDTKTKKVVPFSAVRDQLAIRPASRYKWHSSGKYLVSKETGLRVDQKDIDKVMTDRRSLQRASKLAMETQTVHSIKKNVGNALSDVFKIGVYSGEVNPKTNKPETVFQTRRRKLKEKEATKDQASNLLNTLSKKEQLDAEQQIESDEKEKIVKTKKPNVRTSTQPVLTPDEVTKSVKKVVETTAPPIEDDGGRQTWLDKTANSPAAKAGFSDDERWALQQQHRKWLANRRK